MVPFYPMCAVLHLQLVFVVGICTRYRLVNGIVNATIVLNVHNNFELFLYNCNLACKQLYYTSLYCIYIFIVAILVVTLLQTNAMILE